jgi:hypothetical protein
MGAELQGGRHAVDAFIAALADGLPGVGAGAAVSRLQKEIHDMCSDNRGNGCLRQTSAEGHHERLSGHIKAASGKPATLLEFSEVILLTMRAWHAPAWGSDRARPASAARRMRAQDRGQ